MDIKGFLTKDTAGLPNWAWLAVVGAGIGVAYFGPKLFGNSSSSSSTPAPDSSAVDSTDTGTSGTGTGGSGGGTGGGSGDGSGGTGFTGTPVPPTPVPTPPPTPTPTPSLVPITPYSAGLDQPVSGNGFSGTPVPPTPTPKPTPPPPAPGGCRSSVTVAKWPNPGSTFDDIAHRAGVSVQRLEQLNPNIKDINKLFPGQKVCVA